MSDVINVMTRAQRKKMTTDNGSDQPKVVSQTNTEYVELSYSTEKELRNIKRDNNKIKESKSLMFVPQLNKIFIKPFSQSQRTRVDFARELVQMCEEFNIKEIYIVKNKYNNIFIEKLLKTMNEMKDVTGPHPRLNVLNNNNIKRINDKDDRRVIINDFHILPTSGHAGIRRMYNNIKKYYFWPGLYEDVKNFVNKCAKCQTQKYTNKYIKEPMVITTTANTAFEKIYLDIVGPLPQDIYNNVYILTIQCELTKFLEAYPLTSKSSIDVAKSMVSNFILRYGIPKTIATDRGSEFLSSTLQEVCRILQIKQLNSTAYHHQTIGSLENAHKSLGNFLRIQTDNDPDNWSNWLPFWCFAQNTSVHTSTGYTPFELVFGKVCNIPTNLVKDTVDPLYNYESYPQQLKYQLQITQKQARDNLIKSKTIRKASYDTNSNPVIYHPNDLILVKNETGNKFTSIYSGPYKVIRDIPPNVEIDKNGKIDLVHKNRTKKYISP